MADVEQPAASTDLLLQCCLCSSLLRDAVQLACLHSCCRQCFNTAASKSHRFGVACVSCGTVTQVGSEKPNVFIDGQVRCYTLNSWSRTCRVCTEKGNPDKSAVVWCLTCRHSLCENCVNEHRVNDRHHAMQRLEELKSLDELCSQASFPACAVHNLPVDLACLTCEQVTCNSCWANCKESNHVMHAVREEPFASYVGKLVAHISAIESKLLRKSEVLQKPRNFLRFSTAARDRHLSDLKQRKQRIMDAVEVAYQKIELATKNAYRDLNAEGAKAAATADRIASDLSVARNYICRVIESNDTCEIFKQQKIVRERLSDLSADLDSLSARLSTNFGEVKIKASLPENLEEVVGAWIGAPEVYSASTSGILQHLLQQQQCFSFGAASSSIQLPDVYCWDFALTKDGRSLLIAAGEHGLIEFSSSSSSELSRWLPPKALIINDGWVPRTDPVDQVWSVAALSDGRAAVSLNYIPQRVVLLRRREERREKDGIEAAVSSWWQWLVVAAGGDAWTQDLRVKLPWLPGLLSAHGDVLAVSAWLDQHLQLLSLSRGQRLSTERQREYKIGSLAVTAGAVVTGSWSPVGKWTVKLGGGRRAAYVLDAHSLADDGSDERLWRHVLSSSDEEEDEKLQGICADSSGGCLYAAVWSSDARSGRVSVLSMADGSEVRRVALSFDPATAPQPLLLPVRLSLSDDATLSSSGSSGRVLLLAVLCQDVKTKKQMTVTVHRSTCNELQ